MGIKKDDVVTVVGRADLGRGWVKYILPDGEAAVQFDITGNKFLHVSLLTKVEV